MFGGIKLTIISRDGNERSTLVYEDEESDWDCGVEGCRGVHYFVEWGDGSNNYVCGKGLNWTDNETAQIR
jgi:hypothetical protein